MPYNLRYKYTRKSAKSDPNGSIVDTMISGCYYAAVDKKTAWALDYQAVEYSKGGIVTLGNKALEETVEFFYRFRIALSLR